MSDLRGRIALRIYDAGAYCGECDYTGWNDCSQCRGCVYTYADAVLPLVNAEAAQALRDAAKKLPGFPDIATHGDAARWLLGRAARIEAATPPAHTQGALTWT